MKEIFEQYGGVIITVVAIAALAALVTAIMGNGTSGPVYDAFKNLTLSDSKAWHYREVCRAVFPSDCQ